MSDDESDGPTIGYCVDLRAAGARFDCCNSCHKDQDEGRVPMDALSTDHLGRTYWTCCAGLVPVDDPGRNPD